MQTVGTANMVRPSRGNIITILYRLDCLGQRDTGGTCGRPFPRRAVGARLATGNWIPSLVSESTSTSGLTNEGFLMPEDDFLSDVGTIGSSRWLCDACSFADSVLILDRSLQSETRHEGFL